MNEAQKRGQLEHMEAKCREMGILIGGEIRRVMPNVSFCLILAQQGDGGFTTYISNIVREDCIALLREMIGKLGTKDEMEVPR